MIGFCSRETERADTPASHSARWLGKDVASSFNEVDFYNEAGCRRWASPFHAFPVGGFRPRPNVDPDARLDSKSQEHTLLVALRTQMLSPKVLACRYSAEVARMSIRTAYQVACFHPCDV